MNKIVVFEQLSPEVIAKYIELKGKTPCYYVWDFKMNLLRKSNSIPNFFDGMIVDMNLGDLTTFEEASLHVPEIINHDPLLLQAIEETSFKDYTVFETEESEYIILNNNHILTPKTIKWQNIK